MDSAKLPITGSCPIDLDAIGFDRGSKSAHCTHCEKSVHNLSTLTEPEAKAFLRSVAGQKVCVSYARDAEGQIRFRDPAPIIPITRLRSRRAVAAAVPALGLAAALAACTPVDHPDIRKPPVHVRDVKPVKDVMVAGGMALDPVPVRGEVAVEPIEPVEMVEGNMKVPDPEMMDGEIAVPEIPVEEMIAGDMAVPEIEAVEGEIEAPILDEPCHKGSKDKPERGLDALLPTGQ